MSNKQSNTKIEGSEDKTKPIPITVIMGVHNIGNENILKESIMSILNQTFSDFEFIICDDGSTDNSYQELKQYAISDKRITVLRNPTNIGLAATLNRCLDVANGKYIARMDADDISKKERLEKQYHFLERNSEYALTGSNAELINENGVWGRRRLKEKPSTKDMLFNSPFIHPSIMVRKEAYDKMKGYRVARETYRMEDYDLFMRMYASGLKGYNIQEELLSFREDKSAFKRKKYRYRIDEAKVRYKNFRLLGLMPKGYFYVLKPLIVGLIPPSFLKIMRREKTYEKRLS